MKFAHVEDLNTNHLDPNLAYAKDDNVSQIHASRLLQKQKKEKKVKICKGVKNKKIKKGKGKKKVT